MTLFRVPILTTGASHPAQQFRMLVRDLSNGAEGITQGDDLKVTALGTPGAGVQISDGSGIVRGRANTFQGSYAVANIGAATADVAATGGGAGRSDMVVLRVLDPEYEGSLDPAVDQIMFFEVISNVGSSATTVPGGRSAIPLARIDIPASTATITSAMIVDLRKCANPRRDRQQFVHSPSGSSTAITNTNSTYTYFSTEPGWNIAIPDWATKAIVTVDLAQIRYSSNAFAGLLRATFGASLTLQSVVLDDNAIGIRRQSTMVADTLTIPTAYRGTTQLLRVQAAGTVANTGSLTVDISTTFRYDIEFQEAPR